MRHVILILALSSLGCGVFGEEKSNDAFAICHLDPNVNFYDYGNGMGSIKSDRYNCRDNDGSSCFVIHWVNDPTVYHSTCDGTPYMDGVDNWPYDKASSHQ